jgi:hypothetical protein
VPGGEQIWRYKRFERLDCGPSNEPRTWQHGGISISDAKGIAQEPYVNHLLEVAILVAEATGGSDST